MSVGRGKKGVCVVNDDSRPECAKCGGFCKSNGHEWKCTDCGKRIRKKANLKNIEEAGFAKAGYDVESAEQRAKSIKAKYKKGCRSFVVTSAQNNTGEFKAFLKALKVYCKQRKAELIVIPVHYKNANSWNKDTEKQWSGELEPYLVHGDISLGHVLIRSHIKIEAPSINPLQGKQSHGGNKWTVFGNAQHAMEPVATPADLMPKRMYTTGSVTKRNYSQSDRGAKADFNHVFGALTINFVKGSDIPFIRQLNSDDMGNFYDLDKRYTPKGITKDHRIKALTTGDEHVMHNIVAKETYLAKNSIAKKLKPEYIVRHDVLDGYAGSHHHEKMPLVQFKKFIEGTNCYRSELNECIRFIDKTTPAYSTNILVDSNHHSHLDKWLDRANPNKDFTNTELIHELRALQFDNIRNKIDKNAFQIYLEPRLKSKTRFIGRNEHFLIGDVDVSQHGDVGANGSRGSANGLAKSTYKMTIGHSHSARIVKGVYQVGTSTGKLEYEQGLSDHSNTHCIQYKNGKRTLLDIINGKWCE